MADAHQDWTPIRIATPLPMDVAGTLMQLIGTAYPSAVIDTSGVRGFDREYALVMKVDPAERARRVTKKQVAEAKCDADPDVDVDFIGFEEGWLATSTPEELSLHLGGIAHELFTKTEGAVNFVEWSVKTEDGDRYVLSISKSKAQMPSALLAAANERIAELEAAS